MFNELKGKKVLVIGGHRGIGKAIIDTFQSEGSDLIVGDLIYKNKKLTKINDHFYQIHVDVRNENDVVSLTNQLKQKDLIPDIFVNVAGISVMDYFVDSKTSDFEKVWEINTRGVYFTTKHITRLFEAEKKKGKIIVIDSQAGKAPYLAMPAYVASKYATRGLIQTLALETGHDHINVNAVCPGIIETDMKHRERIESGKLRGLSAKDIENEDKSQIPLGRTGTPQDVANVVLFLASHLADYMTGQAINITGGMTMQ
ncbi:3-ketoacyl-ACP reductase [Philodulcilactobacillus myokoensis]|uniref:3-ketoacyl-ACP reductase n=1 Tax=Philodulcilactobacillus myokoensis TaxID=2929573 RepID=A0A9W6ESX0_9LACO|nr:SDR family NAD(P)-dependent oxidoreductase [Philodulcilactobacillus myokoensis]GLB47496.1 3-ketoacyl-ACP reductase [Philodulcilactobacillus myokoensis]